MKLRLLVILAVSFFSLGAEAKLAGKNVVLVHGFQPGDLLNPPASTSVEINNANNYWSAYWGSRAEATLYWNSNQRVSGGIKDSIKSQLQSLAAQGTCSNGCVFVTHSTGDLVLRYALTKLGQWGISTSQLKVLTVLDFAGAGGGTEIADIAVSISQGSGLVNSAQKAAIDLFLGFSFDADDGVGVLNDLRPSTARATAVSNNNYPRLRFVGAGWEYLGATKPFISGSDDSVVPLHSACGAASKSSYDSCSQSITTEGVITSVSAAPSSLWFNHYPILMGDDTNHSEAINNDRSGDFTTVVNNVYLGVNVDFATTTSREWWAWWKKVRTVNNGSSYSMSANVYNTLN
jgi:hypothetical protein